MGPDAHEDDAREVGQGDGLRDARRVAVDESLRCATAASDLAALRLVIDESGTHASLEALSAARRARDKLRGKAKRTAQRKRREGGDMPTPDESVPGAEGETEELQQQTQLPAHDTSNSSDIFSASEDSSCIVCMERPRNATIVHGETAHACCCIECAKQLQAAGQPCPMCRLPIDVVARQFS